MVETQKREEKFLLGRIFIRSLLFIKSFEEKEVKLGTSLVAQWLRITCQCRGHVFDPWPWKILHAAEQQSPCTPTSESTCHNY